MQHPAQINGVLKMVRIVECVRKVKKVEIARKNVGGNGREVCG
jgi:hypothetical protein